MTNIKLGGWLLVALAIVGLAFVVPAVSAHDENTTPDDAPTDDATADEWATWMDAQMTEHMGPGSVEWMESHMGVTVDEMAQEMADGEYPDRADHDTHGGTYRQGHC